MAQGVILGKTSASIDTQNVVFSTSSPSSISQSITLDQLQSYLNSLPKLITQDITINVSGSYTGNITIQDFYGNGSLTVQGATGDPVSITGSIAVENCACPVSLSRFSVTFPADTAEGSCVIVRSCSGLVRLVQMTLTGGGTGWGVNAQASSVNLSEVSCTQLYVVLYATLCATIVVVDANAAATYSDNHIGAYVYRGGIIIFTNSVPTLLGADTNEKNGGLIVAADGTLL